MSDSMICAWHSTYRSLLDPAYLALIRYSQTKDAWRSGDPLITVYVPTYKRPALLFERAIASVLAQTYENWELIVANHGGDPETGWAVHDLAKRDKRIWLMDVPRTELYPPTAENHWLCGPIEPANAALRVARGDWIARIDDDDVWTPDHLEVLLRFAQKRDYEFVSSYAEARWKGKNEKLEPYNIDGRLIGSTQTWLYRKYLRAMKYSPHCWRKNRNRVNDTDLQERFVKAGVRMGWTSLVTAYIYPRPGETHIGSKAYFSNARDKEIFYRF